MKYNECITGVFNNENKPSLRLGIELRTITFTSQSPLPLRHDSLNYVQYQILITRKAVWGRKWKCQFVIMTGETEMSAKWTCIRGTQCILHLDEIKNFNGKWIHIRFPLPTLLYAGYNVKVEDICKCNDILLANFEDDIIRVRGKRGRGRLDLTWKAWGSLKASMKRTEWKSYPARYP